MPLNPIIPQNPLNVGRLRRGVAFGGGALLVLLVAFYGLARLRGFRFHLDLPGRLGANISQTANGFTYSQSEKGHTLFTIHASKLVQYKGEQAELHDVTITLYGPQGSGRSDKIYGSSFTYDRKLGVAKAAGAVSIDFQSPGRPNDSTTGPPGSTAPSEVHVTTSGITFIQATGRATTEQPVNFAFTRASGSAIGADYNAKTGVLILDHAVALETTTLGPGKGADGAGTQPATVHADHAQLLRDTHQAFLIKAETVFGGERTTSDAATLLFRPDGSAQQVDARGHVRLTGEDGAEMHAGAALVDLDLESQPTVAKLDGGLTYTALRPAAGQTASETMQGTAVTGTLNFIKAPAARPGGARTAMLHHAQFRDAVTFVVQQSSLPGDPNGSSTREMRASTLDVDFAPGAAGRTEPQQALAAGGAAITLHDVPSRAPARATTISGDQLLATFARGRELQLLDGKGNTKIEDTAPDGAVSSSGGDMLHVTFLPAGTAERPSARAELRRTSTPSRLDANNSAPSSSSSKGSTSQFDKAVQTGNVVIEQTPAPGAKNSDGTAQAAFHGTAARGEYSARDQVLTLTGDPHLRNDTLSLSADRVDYHRDTGDALASGDVKSTYVQLTTQQPGQRTPGLGGEGPVHIIADRAEMSRSSSLSVFYGTPAMLARMWQGGSAVAAPVLELSRAQQTLDAHGERGSRDTDAVHATLGAKSQQGSAEAGSKAPAGVPVRLSSTTLHYSDKDRRADLHGAVVAEQPTGTVHSDQAQVFLTPSLPGKPSGIDHIVATSHIVITQPGRRGTGERLVYTASDSRYVLTGSPQQQPRVTDAQKGTTTGPALIFKGADDSVEVASQAPGASSGSTASAARTITDTHSPK